MMSNDSLNKAANLVFIGACLVLVGLAATRTFDRTPSQTVNAGEARVDPLAKGTAIAPTTGLPLSKSRPTVALVVQSQCNFCLESMPFYKRLAALRRTSTWQLAAVSLESADMIQTYVQSQGLEVDRVVTVTAHDLPTSGTPTLVVINGDGTIRGSWLGKLSAAQESDVLATITGRKSQRFFENARQMLGRLTFGVL